MWPLMNSTLATPAWAAFAAREREHLVGHVQADRAAGRADAAGADEHVGAGARAEVEDRLALVQVRHGGRHAATQRRVKRRLGAVPASSRVYSAPPNTSMPDASAVAGPQHEPAVPAAVARAAAAYFSRTASRMSAGGSGTCSPAAQPHSLEQQDAGLGVLVSSAIGQLLL